MSDIFIGLNNDVALAGGHSERGDFVGKLTGFLRSFRFVLAGHGEFILYIAADLPLGCDVFSGLAHVVVVECVPQAVTDHAVDVFDITHFGAAAQMRNMGREGHILLSTRGHDICIAQLDVLCGQSDGAQS